MKYFIFCNSCLKTIIISRIKLYCLDESAFPPCKRKINIVFLKHAVALSKGFLSVHIPSLIPRVLLVTI